jgi:NitT/TauT family transport system permease protein
VIRAAAPDLQATVTSFAAAFAAGVLLALAFSLWIQLSQYATKVFMPVIAAGITVPKVVLLPLFVLWFGTGKMPVIVFGALSGFFPMIVNVVTAASEVPQNQIWLAKAMAGFRSIARAR